MTDKKVKVIKEKQELCLQILFSWIEMERSKKDMNIHDKEWEDLFTSRMILKKFEVFGIDIILPDMLLLILNICVNNNPGQFQVVLKDLLCDIKSRKGPIPKRYVITANDFTMCFPFEFPIIESPVVNEKYEKLWDAQKNLNAGVLENDNLCDTPEWWKEVME